MEICYFTNVYPSPSHAVMRREILALETIGANVIRVAARPFKGPLVEPSDQEESLKTIYLTSNFRYAATSLALVAVTRPIRLVRALLDAVRIGIRTKNGLWKHLMYIGEACVLLRITPNCSHIHANFSNATSIAIMSRILGGPPVSLRIHGPEEFNDFTPVEWDWKFRHAAFVAPISQFGVRSICALVESRYHSKVRMLRCGVDPAQMMALGHSLHQKTAKFELVCVARLDVRKGHDVLFGALRFLRDEGLPVSLRLIGDGVRRNHLERLSQELSLSDAVEFEGWQAGASVINAMKRARVVVLPSLAEGLPVVLMEALALGRPVVATRIMGIPELIFHKRTGWLVEPGDARALAATLKEALLSSDEELNAIGAAGQALIADRHNVSKLMRELVAHIHETQLTFSEA